MIVYLSLLAAAAVTTSAELADWESPPFGNDTGLDPSLDTFIATDVVSISVVSQDENEVSLDFTDNPILLELFHNQVCVQCET